MELINVGKNTYYIKNNTNIGIYKVNDSDIYLIDTGNDKTAGKNILKIIEEQNWNILGIINTHSHADHIGGNDIIQSRTSCKIYSSPLETAFINNPILEPSCLYSAYPFKDLKNKFLLSEPSNALNIDNNLPLTYFNLRGHSFDMIGIMTSDDVCFLGDALISEDTINKYHIFFIYNVEEYLNTLDYLESLNAKLYIASHVEAKTDIRDLIDLNRKKIEEILNQIIDICKEKKTFEDILSSLFTHYYLKISANEYFLVSSTIRAYISYLYDKDAIAYEFIDNKMYWFSK